MESNTIKTQLTDEASVVETKIAVNVKNEEETTVLIQKDEESIIENAGEIEENASLDNKIDPYSYLNRPGFTSEIFKIEVGNFFGRIGYTQLKKLLGTKLNLKPHKIKVIEQNPFIVYVTFKCEEDREKALEILNGYEYKGKKLSAKRANPMADPLIQKRKEGVSEDIPFAKRFRSESKLKDGEQEVDLIPVAIQIKNAVAPLWKITYEEQLAFKKKEFRKLLFKWGKNIERTVPALKKWLQLQRTENDALCCNLSEIRPSPETAGYRNKCEFNIGRHLETGQKTVGFRISSYKEGSKSVAEPVGCPNISQQMIDAAKIIQKYVEESDKDVFNPETHAGYWRQLNVRSSRNKDLMLTLVMHPQSLTEAELEEEKIKIKDFIVSEGSEITSLYFQPFAERTSEEPPFQHVWGKKYIEESLLNMRFRISPEAFFQVNTLGAEVLYSTVKELAGVTSTTTVLDLCCGTGTIGLTLAKDAFKLVGVELCAPAVADARCNAELNGVTNSLFISAKVEDVIYDVLNNLEGDDVVAIVDPPRAGLNNKVIKAIRNNPKIKKLVYLSCNPQGAMTNFIDLSRSESNNYQGLPFLPVNAVPVDIFPHTPHCELVILFQRQEK